MEKNPYVVPLGKVFLDIVSFTFYVARVAFAMKSIIRTQVIVFSLVTCGVNSSIQSREKVLVRGCEIFLPYPA